jgi:predicted membrane-bound mannosyltransferase
MARQRPSPPRGSALLLALVLLGVLTVIGAASVMLASQERINAAAGNRLEFLNACANAAQAKIWAEMAQYGLSYMGSTVQVTPMTLPDGTTVIAPAHYGQLSAASQPLVKDVTFTVKSDASGNAMNERDCTNGACGLVPLGSTYGVTALCIDRFDREFEIELAVKFAL